MPGRSSWWCAIVELETQWLGRLEFRWAERLQRGRRSGIQRGIAPEVVWLLEHHPVITLGRRGGTVVAGTSIPVVPTDRGGLATYHGPGQLVGYVLVDVARRRMGARRLVDALERGLQRWLADIGIDAGPRDGAPGVWVRDRKIAALGLHFARGVSMHGFALNLDVDLGAFEAIDPCGFTPQQVTSVRDLLGGTWSAADQAGAVGRRVREAIVQAGSGPTS